MEEGKEVLLQLINRCWQWEMIPEQLNEAEIFLIFKKGSATLPTSYRPISLLQCIYKIYTALIQRRLAEAGDWKINNSQYGFRARRGTQMPLHIMKRIIEYYTEISL